LGQEVNYQDTAVGPLAEANRELERKKKELLDKSAAGQNEGGNVKGIY